MVGLPERLSAAWHKTWEGTREDRVYKIGIALSLLLGLILRVSGQYFDQSSMWFDEGAWANRLVERSILNMPIRPIAFMWLSKQFITIFDTSEFWYRFLPNTASIVALGFMPYIASQLFQSRVSRFVLVLLWAIQPALIDYAKEFKPYSFEVMMHLVPLLLYLRYKQTGRVGFFWAMIGSLPFLFLFTYNLAFTYPGILLYGLWEGYRLRKFKGALVAVVSGAACLALIAFIYALTLYKASTSKNEAYWGRKYDVFYTKVQEDEGHTRTEWMARKYNDMAALPGLRREVWHPPAAIAPSVIQKQIQVDRLMWLGLHLAGMAYLLLKRRELFVLLVVPFLILIALNIAGRWPIGAFRTNVFLCAYMLPLAMFGFDWIAQRSRRNAAVMGAVVSLVTLVPAFAYGFDIQEKKKFWGARNHEARDMILELKAHRDEHLRADPKRAPEWMLFDCHTSYSHRYYMTVHPEYKAKYADYFQKNFVQAKGCSVSWFNRTLRARLKKPGPPFWVIVSKPKILDPTRALLHKRSRVLFEKHYRRDHFMFLVEPLKGANERRSEKAASPTSPRGQAPEVEDDATDDAAEEKAAAPAGSGVKKTAPAPAAPADPDDEEDDD